MKLYVPEIPEPVLMDTDDGPNGASDQVREIYDLRNYTANGIGIRNGDVCLDIGASIGVWSRWACENGAHRVIAFEPDMHSFKCLRLNTDGLPVEAWNRAVTNRPGPVILYRTGCVGGHTLIDMQRGDVPVSALGTTVPKIFDTCGLSYIDFLKVDTEGAEVGVFDGMPDELFERINRIGVEYHTWVELYYPGWYDQFMGRLTDLYPHTLTRDNPGGQQTMIFAWRE